MKSGGTQRLLGGTTNLRFEDAGGEDLVLEKNIIASMSKQATNAKESQNENVPKQLDQIDRGFLKSFQNTKLEEVETSDSKVVRSEEWQKLKEVFVEYGFRGANRGIEWREWPFNGVGKQELCVLSVCIVGLLSLFCLLLGLLG